MTDKKSAKKRPVALPRLHKSIEAFCTEHTLSIDQTIIDLLDAVQAAWFEEAKK